MDPLLPPRIVARFYWRLAGSIWQDIPLDDRGEATEFARYVDHFLKRTPEFHAQAGGLREMALATYLVAVGQGREPRAWLRRASSLASAEARRIRRNGVATSTVQERLRDRLEAIADVARRWGCSLAAGPRSALREIGRDLVILPRLVPAQLWLVAAVVLAVAAIASGLSEMHTAGQGLAVFAVTFAMLYVLDVSTYVVHVERDGWGDSPEAKAFQDHHFYPEEAGRWTLMRSVSSTGPLIVPALCLLLAIDVHFTLRVSIAVALMCFMFVTQTHGLAHVPDEQLPRWITILQRLRLILPKQPHAVHHDTLDRSHAVFNGWCNPLMDAVGYPDLYARLRNNIKRF